MEEDTPHPLYVAYSLTGAVIIVYGFYSSIFRQKLWINDVAFSTTIGIIVGPYVLNWVDPNSWSSNEVAWIELVEQVARFSLAIQLFGVGLRTSLSQLRAVGVTVLILITLGLAMSWMISSWLIYALFFKQIGIWESLVIGGAITPTDPVIAASVVSGKLAKKYLPDRLTSTLSLESGVNDGFAYPFVFLGIVFLQNSSTTSAVQQYFVYVWILEVITLTVASFILGVLLGLLLDLSYKRKWVDKSSLFVLSLAITLFVLGIFRLAKMNEILGVFIAGIGFSLAVRLKEKAEQEKVQDTLDLLITNVFFLLFGTIIPFAKWSDQLGIRGLGIILLLFTVRRIPVLFMLKPITKDVFKSNSDVFFAGWFGPLGVSAVFYAMTILKELKLEFAWTLISLIVFCSIYLHGLTATPFTIYFGKNYFMNESKEPVYDELYELTHFQKIQRRFLPKKVLESPQTTAEEA